MDGTQMKQILRTSIQNRQLSKEILDFNVDMGTDENKEPSPEVLAKEELRRKRNRESATRSRINQQKMTSRLESKCLTLEDEKSRLKGFVSGLKKEKAELLQMLVNHESHCVKRRRLHNETEYCDQPLSYHKEQQCMTESVRMSSKYSPRNVQAEHSESPFCRPPTPANRAKYVYISEGSKIVVPLAEPVQLPVQTIDVSVPAAASDSTVIPTNAPCHSVLPEEALIRTGTLSISASIMANTNSIMQRGKESIHNALSQRSIDPRISEHMPYSNSVKPVSDSNTLSATLHLPGSNCISVVETSSQTYQAAPISAFSQSGYAPDNDTNDSRLLSSFDDIAYNEMKKLSTSPNLIETIPSLIDTRCLADTSLDRTGQNESGFTSMDAKFEVPLQEPMQLPVQTIDVSVPAAASDSTVIPTNAPCHSVLPEEALMRTGTPSISASIMANTDSIMQRGKESIHDALSQLSINPRISEHMPYSNSVKPVSDSNTLSATLHLPGSNCISVVETSSQTYQAAPISAFSQSGYAPVNDTNDSRLLSSFDDIAYNEMKKLSTGPSLIEAIPSSNETRCLADILLDGTGQNESGITSMDTNGAFTDLFDEISSVDDNAQALYFTHLGNVSANTPATKSPEISQCTTSSDFSGEDVNSRRFKQSLTHSTNMTLTSTQRSHLQENSSSSFAVNYSECFQGLSEALGGSSLQNDSTPTHMPLEENMATDLLSDKMSVHNQQASTMTRGSDTHTPSIMLANIDEVSHLQGCFASNSAVSCLGGFQQLSEASSGNSIPREVSYIQMASGENVGTEISVCNQQASDMPRGIETHAAKMEKQKSVTATDNVKPVKGEQANTASELPPDILDLALTLPDNESKSSSSVEDILTLSLRIATILTCPNSLDQDQTPSNSAFDPDPCCLTLGL